MCLDRIENKITIPDYPELMQDKNWEPLMYAIIYDFIKTVEKAGYKVTLGEARRALKRQTTKTYYKIDKVLEFLLREKLIVEEGPHIKLNEKKIVAKGFVKVYPSVLNWFMDNMPNDLMAIRAYIKMLRLYLLSKKNFNLWDLKIGGNSEYSLLSQIGYCATSSRNRECLSRTFDKFEEAGLITLGKVRREKKYGKPLGASRKLLEVRNDIDCQDKPANVGEPQNRVDNDFGEEV